MSEVKYYDGKNGRIVIETHVDNFMMPPEDLLRLNELSDGYHSYDELYEFRKMYNALLFNEWATKEIGYTDEYKNLSWEEKAKKIQEGDTKRFVKKKYDVHKSWKHYDGEDCFGGGWFIVSAMLPDGLISNHYKAEDWDLFQVPEVEKAKYEFDGHTGQDVLERLRKLCK